MDQVKARKLDTGSMNWLLRRIPLFIPFIEDVKFSAVKIMFIG